MPNVGASAKICEMALKTTTFWRQTATLRCTFMPQIRIFVVIKRCPTGIFGAFWVHMLTMLSNL